MKDGLIRVASVTPDIKVADCVFNAQQIMNCIKRAEEQEVKILVLPELCLTGYTCNDLFLQDILLEETEVQLKNIISFTEGLDIFVLFGLPFRKNGKLFNTAAAVQNGSLLGLIPKVNLPNYSEFYEVRHFTVGNMRPEKIIFNGKECLFGSKILFANMEMKELIIGAEICEDLWVIQPPSSGLAAAGATVLLNPSASDEIIGKHNYRRELVKSHSARLVCGYIYADAGEGESSTDLVFSGHNLIAENGTLLVESERFQNGMIVTELDLGKLLSERRKMTTFQIQTEGYEYIRFSYPSVAKRGISAVMIKDLHRFVDRAPFVPNKKEDREKRCLEIITIQAMGLKKRMLHTGSKCVVIAVSGGLDSTLALLVVRKTFELLGLDTKGIIGVTMPCFGTTNRTYENAVTLIKEIGASFIEIKLNEAVLNHLKDIDHSPDNHDVTYENAQARERTQVLMDLANKYNGLAIGTGDLSELVLGWATYNGDHMSMYGLNASVPKTLVRYLVSYFAEETRNEKLKKVLKDILDTPVSPELLPPEEGKIAQVTEKLVGPYELHDFFLYYILRFGYKPSKVYRYAVYAFAERYDNKTIFDWLNVFYIRFFAQQYKRSCLPDGPKVGTVAVSPRGDLRMPSDACVAVWKRELDQIGETLWD